MAAFNDTDPPTSRKYAAEQGRGMSNRSKTCQTSWSHSSIFSLEKQPKLLNFQRFATTFRSYGTEQGIVMSN